MQEYIINRCVTAFNSKATDGKEGEVQLTPQMKTVLLAEAEKLGGLGERVIAVAQLPLPVEQFPPDFTFETDVRCSFGAAFSELVFCSHPTSRWMACASWAWSLCRTRLALV